VLVGSPLYKDYHRLVLNGGAIADSIQQIANENAIPYWRYTDVRLSRDTAYFYNFGHLNKSGAAIYSVMLAGDIKRYLADSTYAPAMEARK
jgi:hypothetical protein